MVSLIFLFDKAIAHVYTTDSFYCWSIEQVDLLYPRDHQSHRKIENT